MIISQITGGLGNQLFQWAYGYNLCLLNSDVFLVDVSFYNRQNKRQYLLSQILDVDVFDDVVEIDSIIQETNSIVKKLDNKTYYLVGYYQSELYFLENKSKIIEQLSPPEEFRLPFEGKAISMHVRRTDYLESNVHVVQPKSYYDEALRILGKYDKLLVFSDDPEWCRLNLSYSNMVIIDRSQYNDIENIWLMSLCQHNIIANSSYSWWGAYLNRDPDKIVIAPKNWFNVYTTRIYCDDWRLL